MRLALTALFLASACATPVPPVDVERISIVAPHDDKPYVAQCKDLGLVRGDSNDGDFLEAVIDIKAAAQQRQANVILTRPDWSPEDRARRIDIQGRALSCPAALVPANEDAWAKSIRDKRKAWSSL